MMLQEIIVFLLFIAAIGYVGSLFWKSIQTDDHCQTTGCNCDPKEVKKLQKQVIRQQQRQSH